MAALIVILLVGIGFGCLAFVAERFCLRTRRRLRTFLAVSSIVCGMVGCWYISFVMRDPTAGAAAFFLGATGATAAQEKTKNKKRRRFVQSHRLDLFSASLPCAGRSFSKTNADGGWAVRDAGVLGERYDRDLPESEFGDSDGRQG